VVLDVSDNELSVASHAITDLPVTDRRLILQLLLIAMFFALHVIATPLAGRIFCAAIELSIATVSK
jgi:hypothetical protein